MKSGQRWYKREPILFLDGVEGLGPELIGAYAYLLDLIYARDGYSKRDDASLGGRLGCSSRKARSLTNKLLEIGKIHVNENGYLTNKKAETVLKQSRTKSEVNANSGRIGGEKSAKVRKNKGLQEANASIELPLDKIREDKKERLCTKPQSRISYAIGFEHFWRAYPKTPVMSKKEAYAAWKKTSADDHDAIMVSLPKYQSFLNSKPDHPAVHACRYISQRRFDGFNETNSGGSTLEELNEILRA